MENINPIPTNVIRKYLGYLIDKTFKILPMHEEQSPTLQDYIESYIIEIIGDKRIIPVFDADPRIITFLGTLFGENECIEKTMAKEEYDHKVCKREVFKCIGIITNIRDRYFTEV